MVDGMRSGRFAWVLLAGAAAGFVLCVWHFIMFFALYFFLSTYGKFVLFAAMEVFAICSPPGLVVVSISVSQIWL